MQTYPIVLSEIVRASLDEAVKLNSYMSPVADKVVELIQQIEELSKGEFQKLCVRKNFSKGDFLLVQGQVTRKLWYIESGIGHEFIQQGKQILTQSFVFPKVFSDYFPSTVGGLPAPRNIRLLTNASIIEMDNEQIMKIASIRSLIYELRSFLIIFYNLELRDRMTQLQFLTAQERYAVLLERQPILIREIPSIYLADYLGVSPETLSRIRAKVKQNSYPEGKSVTDYIFEKMNSNK